MLKIRYSAQFKKDYKRVIKQGRDIAKLAATLAALAAGEKLPERMRDHQLKGNYHGHRECHIEPDWLLLYRINDGQLTLTATRTGSHAELFGL